MNTTTCQSCGITYGISASPWCRDEHGGGVSGIPGHNAAREILRDVKARRA